MRRIRTQHMVVLLAVLGLIVTGCIISGTFVLDIKVTASDLARHGNSYFVDVDLTDNSVWEDHADNLDGVESVGFELWITNDGPQTTFNLYVDRPTATIFTDVADIEDSTIQVLRNLTLPADRTTHITYGDSFGYLTHVSDLTSLAKGGAFHFYATWTQATDVTIDSARIVVTISASDS
jgi:hypothetical protein